MMNLMDDAPYSPCAIRSFMPRNGRMTLNQKISYAQLYDTYCFSVDAFSNTMKGLTDFSGVFGNSNPVVLEIGFGMGASLCELAAKFPDTNFVGVEVHKPGIGKLMGLIQKYALTNIVIIEGDAVCALTSCIPDSALNGINIFFPDPWPKTKHNKRRLIQVEFVELLNKKLGVNGVLHFATDWRDYAEYTLKIFSGFVQLQNKSEDGGYCQRPSWRPQTAFEQKGRRQGHDIFDLMFSKMH